jgi:hypothetical protein
MEHISPLIQTILWVGLIVWLAHRFHEPIYSLLTALHTRIEAGSTIKAGPFELSDKFQPQTLLQQKEKLDAEVHEAVEAEVDEPALPQPSPNKVKSRFIIAEELALRAIEAEFGTPLRRHVAAGPDMIFDAVFMAEHALHIVEVKYVVRMKNAHSIIRKHLDSLSQFLQRSGWKNVKIVFVLVFEYQSDLNAEVSQFERIAASYPMRIVFRCYPMSQLRAQFGVSDADEI